MGENLCVLREEAIRFIFFPFLLYYLHAVLMDLPAVESGKNKKDEDFGLAVQFGDLYGFLKCPLSWQIQRCPSSNASTRKFFRDTVSDLQSAKFTNVGNALVG